VCRDSSVVVDGLVEGSLSARPLATGGCGRCCGSFCSSSSGRHGAELRAKALPDRSVGLATTASSDVEYLLGGVC
jgi:hypothetical protein